LTWDVPGTQLALVARQVLLANLAEPGKNAGMQRPVDASILELARSQKDAKGGPKNTPPIYAQVISGPLPLKDVSSLTAGGQPSGLAVGSSDGTIYLGGWHRMWLPGDTLFALRGKEPVRALHGHSSKVVALAWNPDGSRLASVDVRGVLTLWDAVLGMEVFVLEGYRTVAWSSDGKRLAAGGADDTTMVWSVGDKE
jgi:WD40 repeat protein